MNLRLPHSPEIDLFSNQFEEPIRIDVDAFVEFSFWISEELLELESRFADPRVPAKSHKVMH